MKHQDIYVYIEVRDHQLMDVSFELLHVANQLKEQYTLKGIHQKVIALLMGYQVSRWIEDLYLYGADEVIVIDHKKLFFPTSQHTTKALVHCIQNFNPEVLLIGATVMGRDIAPRVAACVDTGLTADVTHLEVDPQIDSTLLLMTRPAFGGNLYGTIICPNTFPQMATVRPGVFEKKIYEKPVNEPKTTSLQFDSQDWIHVVKRTLKEKHAADLSKANIILAAGRGMESELALIQQTAETLQASVGASRALVDRGVMNKQAQVGQTGITVRPSIYIACGISGAVQHTAGMEHSQTIIAINTDPNAPIFGLATLGIVADAKEVLSRIHKYL